MMSVFADSAGTIRNTRERVVALATLVASDAQVEQINERFTRLKNRVAEWGIDTTRGKFEFHSYEILQGSGMWRSLSEDRRIAVGKALKETVLSTKLHFAMVLIDKRDGGLQGVDKFNEYTDSTRDSVLAYVGDEERRGLELLIKKLPKKKGFGKLGGITGLLFGLTTGLMHSEGFRDDAKLIVDEQFVKQVPGWELLFQIQAKGWPAIAKLGLFPLWPKNDQPGWHLGNTVEELKSHESYGVQLADFIAYTTKRIREQPLSLTRQIAVVNERYIVPFTGYKGIYLITSYRPRYKSIYRRKLKRQ
mgnify:CR=1 FL=1